MRHLRVLFLPFLFTMLAVVPVFAEDKPPTVDERLNTAVDNFGKVKKYTEKITQRLVAGEKPPGWGGIDIKTDPMGLARAFETNFMEGGIMEEFAFLFSPGYGLPAPKNNCAGVKLIPPMWCEKCLVKIPFSNECLVPFVGNARQAPVPTQINEISYFNTQSDFSIKQIIDFDKAMEFGLSTFQVGDFAIPLPRKLLVDNIKMKPKFIEIYLATAATEAAMGKKPDVGKYVRYIEDAVLKFETSQTVFDSTAKMPTELKNNASADFNDGINNYSFNAVPDLFARSLVTALQASNIKVPAIGFAVWPGGVVPIYFENDLFVHRNKVPNVPGIDLSDLEALAGTAPGMVSLPETRTRFAQANPLSDAASDIGGGIPGMGDLPGLGDLPGIGNIPAPVTEAVNFKGQLIKRSPLFTLSDNVRSSGVTTVLERVTRGLSTYSNFHIAPFFNPRVLGGIIPGMQDLMRFPLGCESDVVRSRFDFKNFSNKDINKIELLLSQFVPGFNANFNVSGLRVLPKCLPHAREAAIPVTTTLRHSDVASVLNKAVWSDASFVPEYTKVYDRFSRNPIGSLNFYANQYDIDPNDIVNWQALERAGIKLDDKINGLVAALVDDSKDQLKDRTQISTTTFKERGFGEYPTGCAHPLRSPEALKDAGKRFALEPTQKHEIWTAFKKCKFGEPSDLVIMGIPIGTIVNGFFGAFGEDPVFHQFKERTE